MASSNRWIKGEDYPAWADGDVYKKTIQGGYLLPDETPRDAYMRVAKTVSRRLDKPEMADKFFEYIWHGWLVWRLPCCLIQAQTEVYQLAVLVLM